MGMGLVDNSFDRHFCFIIGCFWITGQENQGYLKYSNQFLLPTKIMLRFKQ